MKKFTELTAAEANQIQDQKINSIFSISAADLNPFIGVEILNSYFMEIPPINLFSDNDLKIVLAGIDTTTILGRLQWVHLKTYLNGGHMLFRQSHVDTFEILVNFSNGFQCIQLNKKTPSHIFDGNNGMTAVWLNQLDCITESLTLIPSITLQISIDNEITFNRSVSLLVSMFQVNAQVGVINQLYSGFQKLEVKLIYNNVEINHGINLHYQ